MKPINFFEEETKKTENRIKIPIVKILAVIFVLIFMVLDYMNISKNKIADKGNIIKSEIYDTQISELQIKIEELKKENQKLQNYKEIFDENELKNKNLAEFYNFILNSKVVFNDENILNSISYQDGKITAQISAKGEKMIKETLEKINAESDIKFLISNVEFNGEYYNYTLSKAEENHE